MHKNNTYKIPFATLTSLFFLWGFATVCNDILIPFFKREFALDHSTANLVQTFFFGAYVLGSLIYFIISLFSGDPINRLGHKNSLVISLLISATGAALFYPAAEMVSLNMFFIALGVLGFGFSWLQIAANPYIAILGNKKTASSRLNLAQGFNSLGTTIAPALWGWLIFEVLSKSSEGVDAVKQPYLILTAVFLIMAIAIKIIPLPKFVNKDKIIKDAGALRYRHLVLGSIAIFMYVGSEVTIGSNMIAFLSLDSIAGMSEGEAAGFVSIYWMGLMIGRLTGAISLSNMKKNLKLSGIIGIPVIVFVLMGFIKGWNTGLIYGIFLVTGTAGFILGKSLPARTLALFAFCAFLLITITISATGPAAMWSLIGIGLFNSVMWSNIFTLAIENLGKYRSQGSSLLVMGIGGGAVFPYLQGLIADSANLHISFALPLIGYAYIVFYGLSGYKIKNNPTVVMR